MKLLVILDDQKPNVDIVWRKGLKRVLDEKHSVCLIHVDLGKAPACLSLYSLNAVLDSKLEVTGITSVDQLTAQVKKFMKITDEREVVFLIAEKLRFELAGDQSRFIKYNSVAKICEKICVNKPLLMELKDVVQDDESSILPPVTLDEHSETKSVPTEVAVLVTVPEIQKVDYPPEFKIAVDRKNELDNVLKKYWFIEANRTKALNENLFWKAVLMYGQEHSVTLKAAVQHVSREYQKSGDYTRIVGGWCCNTKSASLINKILMSTDSVVEEEESLLAPVVSRR